MLRTAALMGLALVLGVAPGHAQTPSDTTSLSPGMWEGTVALNATGSLSGTPSSGLSTGRGVGLRIGVRPSSSRRTLVEAYGLYTPPRSDPYERTPGLTTLGVRAAHLARRADRRFNPYVSAGVGFWHRAAPSVSSSGAPCRPTDRCASSYEEGTTLALILEVGTYLSLTRTVALRATASAHAPLALGGDQGSPHPVLSIGLSVRP